MLVFLLLSSNFLYISYAFFFAFFENQAEKALNPEKVNFDINIHLEL